jgi:peptidoglycan/xylan/chitin deacetylase (PgdA/CDA1 family)
VTATTVTFHGIGAPARAFEDGEASVWVDRGRFAALLDVLAERPGVRITFDDGNASDVEHALPALLHRGLRATFFVVAGRLGRRGFLGEDDVRALAGAGMTVGSHGMRHRPWRGLDPAALHEEVVVARLALEDVVGAPVLEAACPFGAYDRSSLHALRRRGFRRVFTSDGGAAAADAWLQPRTSVHEDETPERLLAALEGRPSAAAAALRGAKLAVKRWR